MTRHRFDAFSFLAGATTVTIALLVLFDAASLRAIDLRVIGPVIVLALGAALLVGGGRDRPPATVGGAAEPDDRDHGDDVRDRGDGGLADPVSDVDADPGTVDTLVLDRDERDDREAGRRDG
jgi:hypothetical protein